MKPQKEQQRKRKNRNLGRYFFSLFFSGGWSRSEQTEAQQEGKIRESGRAKKDLWMEEERENHVWKSQEQPAQYPQWGTQEAFFLFIFIEV